MNPVTDITATELASRIAKGEKITIVDVRQAKDYARGHIKGALKVPFPWKKVPNIPGDGEVVVVCYVGIVNRICSRQLAKSRPGVLRVKGGMSEWTGELVTNLVGYQWSMDRYVRLIYGSLVLISAVLAFLTSPWWLVLAALVAIDLVAGGIFNRCFLIDQLRAMGYR